MEQPTIKIGGGEPVHGAVNLSGDPYAAIFLISKTIQFGVKKRISNVTRVEFVLNFIDLVRKLGVKVEWINEDTIEIDSRENPETNVNNSDPDGNLVYQRVVIPSIIHRMGLCIVSPLLKNEADFYKSLGLEYKMNSLSLEIRSGLESFSAKYQKRINTEDYSKDIVASRVMLEGIDPHLEVVFDKSQVVFQYLNLGKDDFNKIGVLQAAYNQLEFNLYASLSAFASTEVIIKNYDLSQSLGYLLTFNKIAGSYEVDDGSLKMWPESRDLKDLYDISDLSIDAVGYFAVILSLSINKSVKMIFDKSPEAPEMITDLNIFGCKLILEEKENKYILTIRPIKNLTKIKGSVSSASWGGVVLLCAVIAGGLNFVENLEEMNRFIPSINENLRNLHVDIKG
jgi:hypothetical protein